MRSTSARPPSVASTQYPALDRHRDARGVVGERLTLGVEDAAARTAGWTVVRVSSDAAAGPAYAVRCTTCTCPSRPRSSAKTETTSAATTTSRGTEVGRRRRVAATSRQSSPGQGAVHSEQRRQGEQPDGQGHQRPRRRGGEVDACRPRGWPRRPHRARRRRSAAAPDRATRRAGRRWAPRWNSPAVAPAAAYSSAVSPSGEPPGGTRSTTQPAASPSRAPVRGSADDRGRRHEEDDEVRPEPRGHTETGQHGGDGQCGEQHRTGPEQPEQAEPRDHAAPSRRRLRGCGGGAGGGRRRGGRPRRRRAGSGRPRGGRRPCAVS